MPRNLEERSGSGANGGSPSRNGGSSGRVLPRSMAGKRSPPPEKLDRKVNPCSGSAKDEKEKPNGSFDHLDCANQAHSEQETGRTNTAAPLTGGGGEKLNVEVTEWPRIYIALSRKEKEDDFLAMKGTKLSQRPKKRAKNIDKALQVCYNNGEKKPINHRIIILILFFSGFFFIKKNAVYRLVLTILNFSIQTRKNKRVGYIFFGSIVFQGCGCLT